MGESVFVFMRKRSRWRERRSTRAKSLGEALRPCDRTTNLTTSNRMRRRVANRIKLPEDFLDVTRMQRGLLVKSRRLKGTGGVEEPYLSTFFGVNGMAFPFFIR